MLKRLPFLIHSRPQNRAILSRAKPRDHGTDGAWPLSPSIALRTEPWAKSNGLSIPPKGPRALARVGSILISIVFLYGCAGISENQVCFGDARFYVELAVTPREKAKGLMHRNYLGQDRGMLFIFEKEGIYPFWMKNTLMPLDIIWINEAKEVVYVNSSTEPCRGDYCPLIYPPKKARYTLELNGGMAEKIGLKAGDKLVFDIKGVKLN